MYACIIDSIPSNLYVACIQDLIDARFYQANITLNNDIIRNIYIIVFNL